jgi:hypothetical protein
VSLAEAIRGIGSFLRSQWRDPLLEADYVEEFQQGPRRGRRYSPGRYLRLPGVEKDAVPWPPKEGASRAARTSVTATRWRG